MLNFIKSAFTEYTDEQLLQNEFVEEAKKFYGGRALSYLEAYAFDREFKNQYI